MQKMKNVQISQELFTALIKYHLLDTKTEQDLIRRELTAKLEAIEKRNTYTQYKSARTEEERENARKNYLDQVGMNDDFRW